MTRQEAYIAELSQLLFYMTAWDKAEVLKGITSMINHPETGLQTMEEMGTPMKLAVTLHRQYEPTPEPTAEELAAKAAALEAAVIAKEIEETLAEETEAEEAPAEEVEAEEAPAEEVEAEEAPVEEVEAEEVSVVEVEAEEVSVVEVEAEEVSVVEVEAEEAPVVEVEAEEVSAEEVEAEEAPVEEVEAEEIPAEEIEAEETEAEESEEVESLKYVERAGQEKIFAEIFNAATSAQSAVPHEEEPKTEIVRKVRYLFLIPYIALAIIIGVPATVVCAVANVGVLAATLVSLCGVVYLVIFQLMAAMALSSKLIVLGLTLLALLITILLGVMTVWFLRTATVGFPQFLIEVAKRYGYREVEVQ